MRRRQTNKAGRALVPLFMLAAAPAVTCPAAAQPYCANYSDGSRGCGIPTMAMCEQSVRGVGGTCGPDDTAQMPPPLIPPLGRTLLDPGAPPGPPDAAPGWVPPPPQD